MNIALIVPEVTVCVPSYNTGLRLATTVESVLNQDFGDLEVLIAIEPTPECEQTIGIARDLAAKDSRVRFMVHDEVLGWAGNYRALHRFVRTPYFMSLPHDDALHPQCVGNLYRRLNNEVDAVIAFPNIYFLGGADGLQAPREFRGPLYDRLIRYFGGGGHPEFWKGLVRTSALDEGDLFSSYEPDSFAAEYEVAAKLISRGDVIAARDAIYYKRIHLAEEYSVSNEWVHRQGESFLEKGFAVHDSRMRGLLAGLCLSGARNKNVIQAWQGALWWRMMVLPNNQVSLPAGIRREIATTVPEDTLVRRRWRLCELMSRSLDGDLEGLCDEVEKLAVEDPQEEDAQVLYLRTLIREGRVDRAITVMNSYAKEFPNAWQQRYLNKSLANLVAKKYGRPIG